MPLSDYFPDMEGWTPVDPQLSSAPAIPTPEVRVTPNLRTTLPLPLQYSLDTLKQYNRPWLSSFRFSPLPPGGVPTINSASSSVTRIITAQPGGPGIDLQTNSVNNADQNKLNLRNGTGVTLSPDVSGGVTVGLQVPVALVNGGTGADLSATGGANQFVAQFTAGSPLTVVQPDYNNLAGINKATKYNNLSLVAAGLVSVYQQQNLIAQGGNTSATTLAAIPAGSGMMVRVSVYMIVSRVATTSSTMPDSQIIYTDQDNSTAITINATPGDSGNTLSTFVQGTYVFMAKGSTNVQFAIGQVTPFASSGATSMQFSYRCRVELLG